MDKGDLGDRGPNDWTITLKSPKAFWAWKKERYNYTVGSLPLDDKYIRLYVLLHGTYIHSGPVT